MRTKTLIGILLAGTAGLIALLFVQLSTTGSSPIKLGTTAAHACAKGQGSCLPDLAFVDTTGRAYTAKELAGKVVIVNFWATWCGPCQKEIPALSKVYEQYKDKGVVMLGVLTNDNPSDSELLNFASDYNMSFPIVRYNRDILEGFNYPRALPTTFVYDRGGNQVGRPHVGGIDPDELSGELEELVAQK
jgi:thiol-disulfide isomerase/thioredoxin